MPAPTIKNVFDYLTVHEVVGFSRARPPSSPRSSQVEVEVVFAPVDPANWSFTPGVKADSQWIGCGELARVPIGSRWIDGRHVGQRRMSTTLQGEGVILAVEDVPQGEWRQAKGAAFFPTALTATSRCFRLELSGPVSVALVPVTEVMRAVFGRTSDFLLQLYGGLVDEATVPGRFQVDKALGQLDAKDDSVFQLRCLWRPAQQEALLAALILTDPAVAKSFRGLNQNLILSKDWQHERPVVVTTDCPLAVETKIGFEGRWLARPSGSKVERRFLITRLLSLSFDPAFTTLEVRFPTVGVDKEAPPKKDAAIRYGPVKTIFVHAERDPAPGRPSIEMLVPGAAVMTGSDVEFRMLPDAPTTIAPPPSLIIEEPADEAPGSTGDKVPGGDGNTRQVKTKNEDKVAGPDHRKLSMAATDDVLATLVTAEKWEVSYRRGRPFEDVGKNFLVLIVGVVVEGVEVMVCDGGSTSTNPRAVAVVRRDTATRFEAEHMGALRRFILKHDAHWMNKRAPADRRGFVVEPIHRNDEPEVYAERLHRAIRTLVLTKRGGARRRLTAARTAGFAAVHSSCDDRAPPALRRNAP